MEYQLRGGSVEVTLTLSTTQDTSFGANAAFTQVHIQLGNENGQLIHEITLSLSMDGETDKKEIAVDDGDRRDASSFGKPNEESRSVFATFCLILCLGSKTK